MRPTDPAAPPSKPIVSVQVDMDALWAVAAAYGRSSSPATLSARSDPVWDRAVPRILELLAGAGTPATFFVVGRDAVIRENAGRIAEIVAAGHEIANHSHSHLLDLAVRPPAEQRREIVLAQSALEAACGKRPEGFRAPGYGMNQSLFDGVVEAGLRYDASVLPTPWGAVLRAAARLLARDRTAIGPLQYGQWRVARSPIAPYWPARDDYAQPVSADSPMRAGCMELPVSVTPLARLPFHAGFSLAMGLTYFRACLAWRRRWTDSVAFVLHGADLLDPSETDLPSRPLRRIVFGQPIAAKTARLRAMLALASRGREALTCRDWTIRLGK